MLRSTSSLEPTPSHCSSLKLHIWHMRMHRFNVANVTAGVILAIWAVFLLCVALSFKHYRKFRKPPLFKSAEQQPQQMTKSFYFLKKHTYLFHLIVMSHFKEYAQLDQHCPASTSLWVQRETLSTCISSAGIYCSLPAFLIKMCLFSTSAVHILLYYNKTAVF